MSKQYHQLILNLSQVTAMAPARENLADSGWLVTLAAAFAGVFYFFGLFFGQMVGRVLAGG